jgi:hypothetical protein
MARLSGQPEYNTARMPSPRTTRSRILRALALAAAVSPLGVAWSIASCVLADPPPSLSPIPPEMPTIIKGSMTPPEGIFTGWPVGTPFVVPVQVINPLDQVLYAMVEDDGTPAATLITSSRLSQQIAGPVNSGRITIPIDATIPGDGTCHTFTLYVDAIEDEPTAGQWSASGPVVMFNPLLCNVVRWTYVPAGGTGDCPIPYDAGTLHRTDGSAD